VSTCLTQVYHLPAQSSEGSIVGISSFSLLSGLWALYVSLLFSACYTLPYISVSLLWEGRLIACTACLSLLLLYIFWKEREERREIYMLAYMYMPSVYPSC